jgi:hypothetical protein
VHSERYRVVPYSRSNLIAFFVEGAFESRDGYISRKPQITYLDEYCRQVGIRTLLYESEYVDRHFSEDFGGYYVRCFGSYRKKCSRLHLFASELSHEDLAKIFSGTTHNGSSDWSDKLGYRGFIVIKPLPETVVGRTCVWPAPSTASFPTLRRQSANLFGIDLSLMSLPFQEQDHEVAACATSALWSVLHGTARLFEHPILSPLEITRSAQAKLPSPGRALPNDGLDMYQMADVIHQLGLEAEILDARRKFLLQAYAYAYLRGGVPVLLAIDFNLKGRGDPELHAVALTGYQMGKKSGKPITETRFRAVATRITRFLSHDDGVGPFSAIDFSNTDNLVRTSWLNRRKQRLDARPEQLLVPLYSQIRTPFIDIWNGIIEFDWVIEQSRKVPDGIPLLGRMEWDIFLVGTTDLKKEILSDYFISTNEKSDVLTSSLPRFMWRAVGALDDRRQIDLLFDATDLRQGQQLVRSICCNEMLDRALCSEFTSFDYRPYLQHKITDVIVQHFARRDSP